MTTTSSGKSSHEKAPQIDLNRLILGTLVKEKVRLLLFFGYFFIDSLAIYWLSRDLLDRNMTQVYANPTIVLYFRILVLSSPVLVGLLFGVPLLSTEYESGTYRFLFTLGVGRQRLVAALLSVYAFFILVFSLMTTMAIDHFFSVQKLAGPISIWSFAVFVCNPLVIVPVTLTLFVAGALLGILTRQVVFGIAATILFVATLFISIQLSLEKLLFFFAQRIENYGGNPRDAYNNLVGGNDSTYMFQFQIAYACLLTIFSLLLGYGSLQAIRIGGVLHRKPKQLNEERSNI